MSVTGKKGIGIPIILLHDAEGAIVTVELKDGTQFRGLLDEAQDNMNLTMKNSIKIAPDGKQSNVDIAYVRGANVSFIVLPEMLKQAPFFNRIKMWRKFKGHAVVGAGGVIGERGKIIENSAQGKKMDSNSGGTGSSLVRAPPLGSFPRPIPGMNPMSGNPYMQQPPHMQQNMNQYGGPPNNQPRFNPYGGPPR